MPDPNNEIRNQLTGAFDATCKRPLEEDVRASLLRFIDATVIAAVDKGAEFDQHSAYLIDNFGQIGAALEARNPGAPVSREELVAACVDRVTENLERLDRAMARAEAEGRDQRLEALRGEGKICREFNAAEFIAAELE